MIKAILLLPIKEQKELKKESLEIKCEFCLKKIIDVMFLTKNNKNIL